MLEGRKAIAIDRSPGATFIASNYCRPIAPSVLRLAFEELLAEANKEVGWLYETRCDHCDGKAVLNYSVISQVFRCQKCLQDVPLFDCEKAVTTNAAGKQKQVSACPHCHARGHVEEISTRQPRIGLKTVLVNYTCLGQCTPSRGERRHNDPDPIKLKYFRDVDLETLDRITSGKIPYYYPRTLMIEGRETRVKRDLTAHGVTYVCDLFTKRNLWVLSFLYQITNERFDKATRNTLLLDRKSVV